MLKTIFLGGPGTGGGFGIWPYDQKSGPEIYRKPSNTIVKTLPSNIPEASPEKTEMIYKTPRRMYWATAAGAGAVALAWGGIRGRSRANNRLGQSALNVLR